MATVNIKKLIKESISEYLAELNTEKENQEEASSGYMGYTEKVITEENISFEDKVTKDGNIYLVRKPNKDTGEAGIVQEVSLKELLSSLSDEYIGAFTAGTQALAAGKKALKARDAKLKENIQMGKSKVAELETKIEELKLKIEDNSTRAIHDPKRRDELTETNNTLFTQLEKIENAIEKLKDALEKESPKKTKKEDKENLDEIGMFHDPIGYKKSEPKPQVYTKKFVKATDKKGVYVYDIFKNGKLVKTIEGGEGDANAWMNNAQKNKDNE